MRSSGSGAPPHRHEHRIGGIGEVPARIDERPIEIEDDETERHGIGGFRARYPANEVGVSHTLTRTTGSPCSAGVVENQLRDAFDGGIAVEQKHRLAQLPGAASTSGSSWRSSIL